MEQMDTSEHRWLRKEDEYKYLIASKDDASGRVFARFYTTDSTLTNMDFMKRYIERFGRPMSFYLDHASHFTTNPPKEGKADWKKYLTQIQRASQELDIDLVFAGSPQAKGRIEREFRTLQDRLYKLMKWDNVATIEEANEYLETFLQQHNKRFMVAPAQSWDPIGHWL
jgi:transposase InsO family protein